MSQESEPVHANNRGHEFVIGGYTPGYPFER
jgi:hypothetical protein